MSDHGSPLNEDAQWNINSLGEQETAASTSAAMQDQYIFDSETFANDFDFSEFDPTPFSALDLENINMANTDCNWAFAPLPGAVGDGDVQDFGESQTGNVYGEFFNPLYPQNQMLDQEPTLNGEVHPRGGGFVPNMISADSPLLLAMSADYAQDSDLQMQYPSFPTGLTVLSTLPQSPKTNTSSLANNVGETSTSRDVADESTDSLSSPESASPPSTDEDKISETRYVSIRQNSGTRPVSEHNNPRSQTYKTASKLKVTKAKDPPRRITTGNPQYQPNAKYTKNSYPSEDWDCFEYTEEGELDPARLYTASEINMFLFSHPLGTDLAIRIQRNPPRSRPRYPTNHSHRCRFTECPFYPNNTINQGHWAVSFDELTTSHPDHDPYVVAGYVHLWCLERFTDFPKICAELNVHPDTRKMPKEHRGRNPMAMGTRAEEACATKFIKVCQNGNVPETYPRFNVTDRPYEGTLTHRMACVKLRKEPKAVDGQRAARMKLAEYEGSNLRTHMGDLMKEVELRERSRSHRNQNRLIVNVKHKRVFRGEDYRRGGQDEVSEDSDDDEEDDEEGEEEEEKAEDLENFRVPVLKKLGNTRSTSTTAGLKQLSIQDSKATRLGQSQGKKRGADDVEDNQSQSKRSKSGSDRESEESDEEALKLEQQKIELELRLLALKRKEKAAKRAKDNAGEERKKGRR